MTTVKTRILPRESVSEAKLTYVVIGARQEGLWIFVRHRQRMTWEMPAGHIEAGETPGQAAVRELYEETGTVRSDLEHLCDYEVTTGHKTGYGRLYRAEVFEREEFLEHETGEIQMCEDLPGNLTYPEVQTLLFEEVKQQLRS
ncbi:MAG: NUDIX domain-containing protein [Bacteroidota bacterium]